MISWDYDRSGLYSSPVIVVENKFKYLLSDTVDNVDQFRCIHGCPAIVKLESKLEVDVNGWETVTKTIADMSPLSNHSCHSQINQLETLDSALSCFNL